MWLLPQIRCPCQCRCLPAPLLFGSWGLVQVSFDASKSRHKLLSESARPAACALWAHWHIPVETGRLVATAGLQWMWRRWLTERRLRVFRKTVCVWTHVLPGCLSALTFCYEFILVVLINIKFSSGGRSIQIMLKYSVTMEKSSVSKSTLYAAEWPLWQFYYYMFYHFYYCCIYMKLKLSSLHSVSIKMCFICRIVICKATMLNAAYFPPGEFMLFLFLYFDFKALKYLSLNDPLLSQ